MGQGCTLRRSCTPPYLIDHTNADRFLWSRLVIGDTYNQGL